MAGAEKRIGIMGGTFDPIHIGHLILGEKAYEQFHLDKVLFMPSGNPPHKKHREGRADDTQRIEMVRRAIEGNPHFELSLAEMYENGYTYTYHTLESLTAENANTEYFFIIGADSLYNFETWMKPERICRACTLAVAVRDNTPDSRMEAQMARLAEKYRGRFVRLDTGNMEISSEMLRQSIQERRSVRYYIPEKVIEYISANGIYSGTDLRSE